MAKKLKKVEPQQVKAADIPVKARRGKSLAETMMDYPDPDHRWDRPLQAPGRMQVDFEERVNFQRLHTYRLARTKAALARSGMGAMLCFDQYNVRYTTSTVIGEWARDRTLLVATHRPAALELVDRIVVIEAGRVVLDAPRAAALEQLARGITVPVTDAREVPRVPG